MSRKRDHIKLIGVELEGSFGDGKLTGKPDRFGSQPRIYPWNELSHVTFEDDGSIHDLPPVTGEAILGPLPPEECFKLIPACYPKAANASCGMHFHMSFSRPYAYQLAMHADLQDRIFEALRKWVSSLRAGDVPLGTPERLSGQHKHAQQVFFADLQARMTDKAYHRDRALPGHRYTGIAYPWSAHRTIECRILPVFPRADTSIEAIKLVLDTTRQFLLDHAKREPVFEETLKARGGYQEVTTICV